MGNIKKTGILLILGIIVLFGSVSCGGGGGIAQEVYDSVVNELNEIEGQLVTMQEQLSESLAQEAQYAVRYAELNVKYEELKNLDTADPAELATLEAQYAELSTEHEELQGQNAANINEITALVARYDELQAQYNALAAPLPEITEVGIEQAVFTLINQERSNNGLDELEMGSNLFRWALINSESMSVSKQNEQYTTNWVAYQQAHIATGYNTVDELAAATMIIWQSNELQYENNVLADDAVYGAVRVVKSGDIYYITFLASNFP